MDNSSNTNVAWWKKSHEDEAYVHIFDIVTRLHDQQTARMQKNLRSLRLYGSDDFTGAIPYSYSSITAPDLPENRVKINVISSMCDTVTAKIAKMKPRVSFLTSGADAGLQTEAKKLTKYTMGAFYKNKIHQLHQRAFKDSTILDIGALKHFIKNDKICTERVLATEIYTDIADTLYGEPTHMYQMKFIHKDVLKEMFPDHAGMIDSSGILVDKKFSVNLNFTDHVAVIEAWHLPLTEDKKDGKHVICIEQGNLVSEPYIRERFPFTFFRWTPPIIGFYGQSLADRLTGNQIEINKMLRIIQKSFHLGSAFKVFLESGSKVVKEHLNNEIGSIVYYTGAKPDYYTPQTVHPEYFRHLEWLIQSSYEEAGVSQLTASSKKPAGLDSKVALREFNDIETERFAIISQNYEASFLDTASHYIELSKELSEQGGDFEVVAESKKFIESIKWSDINIEENEYMMQMFPTSMLPHEPAGRLAMVQELMESGMIPPEYGLRLLDFPDLESYLNLKNAAIDDLMDTLDEIINKGEFNPPEPYQDLQRGIEIFQAAYLKAKHDNVPTSRLSDLQRWMTQAKVLLDRAAMAQQNLGNPVMAQAQGQPQAQPGAENMAPPGQAPGAAPGGPT